MHILGHKTSGDLVLIQTSDTRNVQPEMNKCRIECGSFDKLFACQFKHVLSSPCGVVPQMGFQLWVLFHRWNSPMGCNSQDGIPIWGATPHVGIPFGVQLLNGCCFTVGTPIWGAPQMGLVGCSSPYRTPTLGAVSQMGLPFWVLFPK